MKIKTLNKVPSVIRGAIAMRYKAVYRTQTFDRKVALSQIYGMISAIYLMGMITLEEWSLISDYYGRWFSREAEEE